MFIKKEEILAQLEGYSTSYLEEQAFLSQTVSFVKNTALPCSRNTLEGHLTASAWILNSDKSSALLIHHKKLDRWFQPGGHIEDHDTSLLSASMREAKEECGIQDPKVWSPEIFDIDVHTIPKRKEVPEHLHYDIRFCFIATNNEYKADLTEVKGIKWVTLSECILQADKMGSVSRMALKIQ